MRRLIFIILSLFFLFGCVQSWNPLCRHNAMYSAIVVGEKYPVRIVVGTMIVNKEGTNLKKYKHAETQAFVNNEWIYIRYSNHRIHIVKKGSNFHPEKIYSFNEYNELMKKLIIAPNNK